MRTPGVFHGHITCSYCTHTGVYGMLGTVFPSGFTSHFVSYTTYNTEDIQPPYWQLLAIWLLVGFVRVLIGGWSTMRWSCYLFHQYRWSKRSHKLRSLDPVSIPLHVSQLSIPPSQAVDLSIIFLVLASKQSLENTPVQKLNLFFSLPCTGSQWIIIQFQTCGSIHPIH